MTQKKIPSTKTPFFYHFWIAFILMLFLQPFTLNAQLLNKSQNKEDQQEEIPEWSEDSLGRRSPRGTVYGFITAVANKNYEKAGRYLNVRQAEVTESSEQLAQLLQNFLNKRGQILPYAWISSESSGKINDELPPSLDRIGSINIEGDDIELYVEEVKGPEGGPIWLISSETVEKIDALKDIQPGPLFVDRFLPPILKSREWGGVPIGHWLIMILLAAFSYLVVWAVIRLILVLLPWFWPKAKNETTTRVLNAFALPIKIYLAVWLFVTLSQDIGISIVVRQRLSRTTLIVGFLAFLMLLWRLTEFIGTFSKEKMTTRGNLSGVSVVLFLRRAAKIAIVIFGIIIILGTFGVDVTTGLAALGIGGLALALGAQKTIENFVGSVTVITDQPVRVGDFCMVGDTKGTVEQIGMRSTRIRTLERTVVTIPNGEFSSSKIENYAHRDRFLYNPVFSLRYESTPDQIRYLLVELRAILFAHPMVLPDPARVRFVELAADSINIAIFAYLDVKNFDDYLEVKEDLLLRMMDVVNESGTGFAFPSQTLYFGKDQGLSKEKSEKAEEKVREWRKKGELQIPKFDPEWVKDLKEKTKYPPEGSSVQGHLDTGKLDL